MIPLTHDIAHQYYLTQHFSNHPILNTVFIKYIKFNTKPDKQMYIHIIMSLQ